jgi:hypothetical protein
METNQLEVKASDAIGFADLYVQQQRKCTFFLAITNDEEFSVQLVIKLENKGENTFKKVQEKSLWLNHKDPGQQAYILALYTHFQLNERVGPANIIGGVGKVRRSLAMIPYMVRARESSERDFLNLFIVDTVEEPNKSGKMVKVGYIPRFRLKADYKQQIVDPKAANHETGNGQRV